MVPAVVLGGGITALSVARSLAAAGVPVHLLDGPHSPGRYSRAVRSFTDVGVDRPQERMLEWLRSGPVPSVVLAGSDEGVELMARNPGLLQQLGYLPVEGDAQVLLTMLDKTRTYELAREHGIPAPRVLPMRTREEVDAAVAQLEFPCVLKPVHSHLFARRAGRRAKVKIVYSEEELRRELDALQELDVEVFVTEVILGTSDEFVSYYGYLDEHGESLLSFTKRKLRQHPPGFGLGTYHETTDDPEVAAAGLRFLHAAGVRGLGNVEFKRDSREGELKLIECNPRFTMSNELIRKSGVDLALLSYNRVVGLPLPEVGSYRVGMRLWDPVNDTRAFIAYRNLGELSAWAWCVSLAHRQCFPAFRASDPLPALARAKWMLANANANANAKGGAGPPRPVMSTTSSDAAPSASAPRRVPAPAAPKGPPGPRVIEGLARNGGRGRAVAARLDLLRSTGVGPVWRRLRAEPLFAALGPQTRDMLYERIWAEAAGACSAEIAALAPGLFELSRDGTRTRVYQQTVELDDPVTLQVALDKTIVQRLMLEAGLPPSDRVEWTVDDPEPALAFLARVGGLCVVKPAAGTGGGHGVIPGIETPADVLRARIHATTRGERLLIERQAEGNVYRLLFLDGELLDVVRSVPANVTGDGGSTVELLIAHENDRRVAARGDAGLSLLGMNLDTLLALRRAGLKLSSVLPAGECVSIRTATNNNAAEDNQTWRGEVATEVFDAARAAVRAVGLRLAGVDVISSDLAKPLAQTGGMITEVNGTPGLHHHYLVSDPDRATRVAIPILECLLSDGVAPTRRGSASMGSKASVDKRRSRTRER